MTATNNSAKRVPPKGGRKGGTVFPRVALKKAVEYAAKLVSKTFTGPQPESTILSGVFGHSGGEGQVRVSALKQYGLLQGSKAAYEATQFARDIGAASSPEEKNALLQRAFLNPKLFKQIFDTFHGDTVSKGKIRQRALALDVHPESADDCVRIFMESAETAGVGTLDGESIALAPAKDTPVLDVDEVNINANGEVSAEREVEENADDVQDNEQQREDARPRQRKAGVSVSLTVDSSSDPDKLQKQLELLRKFGVI